MLTTTLLIGAFSASAETELYSSGNYQYILQNNEATITRCVSEPKGKVVVPDTLDGYPVTTIFTNAFRGYKNITEIIIPDSVKEIDEFAFEDCTGLQKVTLPEGLSVINGALFRGCTLLTSVNIPNNVTFIDQSAFSDCTSLEKIDIPQSVTRIEGHAFYKTGIYNNEDNWEDGVLYIGNHLISAKTDISGDYTVKCGTKTIAGYAFYQCKSLTGIEIPETVVTIDNWAFHGCINLKEVHVPSSVNYIGFYVFYYCLQLEKVTLPVSLKHLGVYCFMDCDKLTSIDYTGTEEDWNKIDGVLAIDDKPPVNYLGTGVIKNGWCYLGQDGKCVTNQWKADSIGWCYLGQDGNMLTDTYVYDSIGKCYVDKNGYWDGKYIEE